MKEIPLTRGYVALVDDEDFESISAFNWFAHTSQTGKTMYAARNTPYVNGKRKELKMHQQIMGFTGIDHKDGNGLNNQRSNLRQANRSQNGANSPKDCRVGNTSLFKGVYRSKGKWCAQIRKDGKSFHLGYFKDEVDAATAYNFKAEELFEDFARMNAPLEQQ